jgi:hypothetical protein
VNAVEGPPVAETSHFVDICRDFSFCSHFVKGPPVAETPLRWLYTALHHFIFNLCAEALQRLLILLTFE